MIIQKNIQKIIVSHNWNSLFLDLYSPMQEPPTAYYYGEYEV